jgi:23S rRNA G2445 N2-methylase RlmL
VQYEVSELERASARKKRYDGEYKIYATDIDPEMIKIAKENADRAGQE